MGCGQGTAFWRDIHAAGARAGRTVIVWIDGSGRPAAAPQQHSDVAGQVILATALAPVALILVALILVLVAAGRLPASMLDRRRLAAWDDEWAQRTWR